MHALGVIPARYESSRFPGKPLAMIGDKPMIWHVWNACRQSNSLDKILVATDDDRILDAVIDFGGEAVMTSPDHKTGTERVAEAARAVEAEVILNIQGDEPFINPGLIDEMIKVFVDDSVMIATPVRKSVSSDDPADPNSAKVVFDKNLNALYFSRLPIPMYRENGAGNFYWLHIGLYAYRKDFLLNNLNLGTTPLEEAEKLEQIRFLEHGFPIRVVPTDYVSHPVDSPADLERANNFFLENQHADEVK